MNDLESSTKSMGNAVGAGFAHGLSTLPPGLQLLTLLSPVILAFILPSGIKLNPYELFGFGITILMIMKGAPKLFISLIFLTGIMWASIAWQWSNWVVIVVNLFFIGIFTHNFIQGAEVDDTGRCVRSYDIEETVSAISSFALIALLAAHYFDYTIGGLSMNWISWVIFVFTVGLSFHLAEQKTKEAIESRSSYFCTFLLSLCFMYWLLSIVPRLTFS